MRPRLLPALLLAAGSGASCAAHAAAPCPTSAASFFGNPAVLQTRAVFDSTVSSGPNCTNRLAYDLRAGTTAMRQCGYLGATTVTASDAFDVVGVPAGTPVAVVAEYTADLAVWTPGCGGTGCTGTAAARLQIGALSDERVHAAHLFNGRAEYHEVISLPVTLVAGQPVVIDCILWGRRNPGGSHASEGVGTLRFRSLPAGVAVVSCQGYESAIVPTRSATWGSLKLLYR